MKQTAHAPVNVGKMAALLLQEFEASELSLIPEAIKNRLENIVSTLQSEIDSLKAQHQQYLVDIGESADFVRGATEANAR